MVGVPGTLGAVHYTYTEWCHTRGETMTFLAYYYNWGLLHCPVNFYAIVHWPLGDLLGLLPEHQQAHLFPQCFSVLSCKRRVEQLQKDLPDFRA